MLVTTAMANLDRMPEDANATDAGDLAARTPNCRRRLANLDDAKAKLRDAPHVASQQMAAHDKVATVVVDAHVFAKQMQPVLQQHVRRRLAQCPRRLLRAVSSWR